MLTTLLQDQNLIPSTHTKVHNPLKFQYIGIWLPHLDPKGTECIDTLAENKTIKMIKKEKALSNFTCLY